MPSSGAAPGEEVPRRYDSAVSYKDIVTI